MVNNYPKKFSVDLLVCSCSNNCRHCYSHAVKSIRQPPLDKVISLISRLRESTLSEFDLHPWCLMHDPLLVKDVEVLVAYIKKEWPASSANLVSNLSAIAVRPELADRLWDAGIRSFQFSLYGTGSVHDRFAGRDGAYDGIMRALPILLRKGYSLKPVIWLHRGIGPSLPALGEIWEKHSFSLKDGRLPADLFSPIGGIPGCAQDLPALSDLEKYAELLPEAVLKLTEGGICRDVLKKAPAESRGEIPSARDFDLAYTVLPDGEIYEFWAPLHKDFRLGNAFSDGMDRVHERYYSGDYPGEKKLAEVSDEQAVKECGNAESERLFPDEGSLLLYYKLKKLGYIT